MDHNRTTVAVLVIGTVGFLGSWKALGPTLTVLLLAAALLLLSLLLSDQLIVPAVLLTTITTLPAGLNTDVAIGAVTIRVYEPLLLLAVAWVTAKLKPPSGVTNGAAVLLIVALLGAVVGWSNGNPGPRNVYETQLLVDLIAAFYVAGAIVAAGAWRGALWAARWALWISAGLLVATSTSVLNIELAGREEATHLGTKITGDATRFLTASQFAAAAALFVCVSLMAQGGNRRQLLWWAAPSIVIVFLGFSRNTLIGLAVALAVTVIASRRIFRSSLRVALNFAALAGVGAVLSLSLRGTAFSDSLAGQFQAFSGRVLGGLSSSARTTDTSAIARNRETANLLEQPLTLFGHGFGYAYQSAFGTAGDFSATIGPYYAHNFWLWILVKGGVVGALVFLYVTLSPVLRIAFGSRPAAADVVAIAAGSAALLAICIVAPLPEDSPNSFIFGAMTGAAAGALSLHRGRLNQSPTSDESAIAQPVRR